MELLQTHYRLQTVEIAEHFKFFKRTQGASEGIADFMAALRCLAKTCNFGQYLETALCDQFVCGLRDEKCQQELLSVQDLMAAIALQMATAAEAVSKETQAMRETTTATGGEVNKLLQFSKPSVIAVGKQAITPQTASSRV